MTTPPAGTGNRLALAALTVGVLSLPAAVTYIGGLILGFAAVVLGFVGVAKAYHLDGQGQGQAVAGVVLGMFGMALPVAVSLFLAG